MLRKPTDETQSDFMQCQSASLPEIPDLTNDSLFTEDDLGELKALFQSKSEPQISFDNNGFTEFALAPDEIECLRDLLQTAPSTITTAIQPAENVSQFQSTMSSDAIGAETNSTFVNASPHENLISSSGGIPSYVSEFGMTLLALKNVINASIIRLQSLMKNHPDIIKYLKWQDISNDSIFTDDQIVVLFHLLIDKKLNLPEICKDVPDLANHLIRLFRPEKYIVGSDYEKERIIKRILNSRFSAFIEPIANYNVNLNFKSVSLLKWYVEHHTDPACKVEPVEDILYSRCTQAIKVLTNQSGTTQSMFHWYMETSRISGKLCQAVKQILSTQNSGAIGAICSFPNPTQPYLYEYINSCRDAKTTAIAVENILCCRSKPAKNLLADVTTTLFGKKQSILEWYLTDKTINEETRIERFKNFLKNNMLRRSKEEFVKILNNYPHITANLIKDKSYLKEIRNLTLFSNEISAMVRAVKGNRTLANTNLTSSVQPTNSFTNKNKRPRINSYERAASQSSYSLRSNTSTFYAPILRYAPIPTYVTMLSNGPSSMQNVNSSVPSARSPLSFFNPPSQFLNPVKGDAPGATVNPYRKFKD